MFRLSIGVQLIKIGNTECKVCIGKKFYSLGLGESHKQSSNVLFDCAFLKKESKCVSSFYSFWISFIASNDDPARIQVIVQGLRFP